MENDEFLEIIREDLKTALRKGDKTRLAALRAVISAIGPGDKGKVMSRLMPQVKGKAEGQMVNAVVSELLAGT